LRVGEEAGAVVSDPAYTACQLRSRRIAFDEALRGEHSRGRVSGKTRREITDTFIFLVREQHRQQALERWRAEHPRPEHPRPEFPEDDEGFDPF
jgi:hypothetical protein